MFGIVGTDDENMIDHARELIETINQIVPETVEEEEEEIDENVEFESEDEDAMEE